jgi:hypothetical protein
MIEVEKIKGTSDQHQAVFKEPEILAQNGGKPLKIPIEDLENYFKKDSRLYNYF